MGFQSDVYLGWQGEDSIRKVLSEPNLELSKLDEKYSLEIPDASKPIRMYLSQKYNVTIPEKYRMAELSENLHYYGPDYEIEPKDYIFGVQLTYRYVPVFLDFMETHGGLYIKKLDKNFFDDIEWMRNFLIQKGYERYKSAEIFIRDEWY